MKNSIFAMTAKLISLIVTFFYTILIAREFGVEIFGEFNLLKAIITVIFVFASLGNDAYIISEASSNNNLNFRSLYYSRLIFFLFLSFPIFLYFDYHLFLVVLLTYFFQLTNYGYLFCLIKKESIKIFNASISSLIVSLIFAIGFIYVEFVRGYLYLIPIYYFCMNLFLLSESKAFLSRLGDGAGIINSSKTVLIKIWPVMLTSALIFVFTRIDIFLLSFLMSNEEVGIYSVATQLTEPLSFVITAFSLSIIPNIKEISDTNERNKLVVKYLKFVNLYSLFVVICCFLIGDFAINLFYGNGYSQSYDVLILLAFSKVFVFANTFLSTIMIVDSRYMARLFRTLVALILNLLLALVLIPEYGMQGAAISVTVTQFLSVVCLNYMFKETRIYAMSFFRSVRF